MELTIYRIFIFFIGAAIGSFLNVVAMRYIAGKTITGRSMCPHCKRQLVWWELIPIFSFIFLRGRCRTCQGGVSPQYFLVELITGLLFIGVFTPWPVTIGQAIVSLVMAGALCILVVLFLIDFHTFLLPDFFIGMLIVVTFMMLLLVPHDPSLVSRVGGAMIGSGFLLFLWILTRGRGIGLGDVKLLVPVGALLGTQGIVVLLWLAFTSGGLVGIYLLLRRKASFKTPVPFGPFLTAAAILLLLFPQLIQSFFSIVLGIS